MFSIKTAATAIAAAAMVSLVVPAAVEPAFAQDGKRDGARQGRGGGGGGDRARSGGGGSRPEVRSAPSGPRFSPPPRIERPAIRMPEVRSRPEPRQFSRSPSELRRPAPVLRRPPVERRIEPRIVQPRVIERGPRRDVRRVHRPWRPGLRWRYIYVPTYIFAQELEWCHYHRYRVPFLPFHRDVRCHFHEAWSHPSIRYVEGY